MYVSYVSISCILPKRRPLYRQDIGMQYYTIMATPPPSFDKLASPIKLELGQQVLLQYSFHLVSVKSIQSFFSSIVKA